MKIPKTVNTKLAFGILLISVILASGLVYVFAATPGTTYWIGPGIYPGAPDYTIWKESSNYFAKDANGNLAFDNTNATTLFNAVEDAAGANSRIHITAGIYYLSGTYGLDIDHANVTISGDGRYNTILYTASGSNLTAFIRVSKAWCTIEHIGLRGSTSGVNTLDAILLSHADADYFTLKNCYIGHFERYGVYLSTGNNIFMISENYIGWFSEFDGSDSAAIFMSGSADGHIANNQLAGGKYVIRGSSIGSIVITGNKVFGCSNTYFYLDSPLRCIISDNIIGGASPLGADFVIYITSYSASYGKANVISGNMLYGSNQIDDIIRLRGNQVFNNTITGNYMENAQRGVNEYDGTEDWNLVVGNSFRNMSVASLNLQGANSVATANLGASTYP